MRKRVGGPKKVLEIIHQEFDFLINDYGFESQDDVSSYQVSYTSDKLELIIYLQFGNMNCTLARPGSTSEFDIGSMINLLKPWLSEFFKFFNMGREGTVTADDLRSDLIRIRELLFQHLKPLLEGDMSLYDECENCLEHKSQDLKSRFKDDP